MKTQFMKFTLAAGFGLALAFTFSCSSDDDGGGGSSSSNGAGGSSSSNGSKTYKTVEIDAQIWMAENLNEAAGGSKCYENSEANCDKYGRLYNWSTAKTVCPSGWHLPTQDEWLALTTYIDIAKGCQTANSHKSCAAKHLKAKIGWNENGNGLDTYEFSALPGSYGNPDGSFSLIGKVGNTGSWWSASELDGDYAYGLEMHYDSDGIIWSNGDKSFLSSVRCVKD